MTIEWLRDLVIIISGLALTAGIVISVIMCYSLYRRANPILESFRKGKADADAISGYLRGEILKPMVEIAVAIQGIFKAYEAVKQVFGSKKEKEDG